MPNPRYVKGVRKERKIVNMAKAKGLIAFRSAGSHSPIDVCIIDMKNKWIRLVQCKSDNISRNYKRELEHQYAGLNGEFLCSFRVE